MLKRIWDNFEKWMIGLILIAISIVAGVQVFFRYVLHNSLSWSEEFMRFAFIWMVMLGFSAGVKQNSHIRVTIITDRLKGMAKYVMEMLISLIFLATAIFVFLQGCQNVMQYAQFPQLSPALEVPMQVVYLAGPVGFGLTAIRLVERMTSLTRVQFGKGGPAESGKTEEGVG